MSDFTPTPNSDPTPSIVEQTVALVTRHGLTVLAGILAEHGVLSSDQQTQFISIGAAIAAAGAALAWSWIQKHNTKKAIVAVTEK